MIENKQNIPSLLVTVSKAKEIIEASINLLTPVVMPLGDASGHVLAEDVFASIDIPAFDQSSMDGYAFKFVDKGAPLKITGEMQAGTELALCLNTGEAARIFTGAPLPHGADTVVMQEKVSISNGHLIIDDAALQQGNNVRLKGAEIKAGEPAMWQNNYLSPAAIGFLAGIGFAQIKGYPMPSVTIIVTGKELQRPGVILLAGQVYESNSFSLTAAMRQAGIKSIKVVPVDDDLLLLKEEMANALGNSDLVLLTGGVSVGNYDFVVEAAHLCDVQLQFHKVKQRPGKPLYFGTKNNVPVFGLPGNPSSVLSCFYNYVLPAIGYLSGKKNGLKKIQGVLTKNYPKAKGLTYFLKGAYNNGEAKPLSAQESFQLSSFAQADCFICLEEQRGDYVAGETVEVFLLPS